MRIIAIVNQKGGCGKTTSCVNIAACLAIKGKKVLLIDLDPQASTTSVFYPQEPEVGAYEVIVEDKAIEKAIYDTTQSGLKIMPSDINLSGADLRLSCVIGREKKLKNAITKARLSYDYIIIDTPPSLSILTVNALTCATEIFVPINMSYFALKGVKLLEETITQVRENLDNPGLQITGVISTMFDPVTNVSKDVDRFIRDYFREKVFNSAIHNNVKLEEAHSAHKHIFEYAPKSKGAEQYIRLTEEIMNNER
jgi:chromosome partitioning protein